MSDLTWTPQPGEVDEALRYLAVQHAPQPYADNQRRRARNIIAWQERRIAALEAEVAARKRLAAGHQVLLAVYRTQPTPTRKTMRTIDKAKADLEALGVQP